MESTGVFMSESRLLKFNGKFYPVEEEEVEEGDTEQKNI